MRDFWHNRSCLVTGGAGFGGSHLCERLLQKGARVHVLDRLLPDTSYLRLQQLDTEVNFLFGDIRDTEFVRLILSRFQIDTVFHLAAQPIVPMSNVLPMETLAINAMGTYSVLDAIRTGQVERTVFASSGAYYGATTADHPISEDHPPLDALNIYAPSKVAGDAAARAYARIYGLKIGICRFMNTYGPGDTNFTRIIPRAAHNLLEGRPYDFGDRDDGSSRVDFLYIGDMAEAYIRTAEHLDRYAGEPFNFGSGQAVSTAEVAALASRMFDGRTREGTFSGPVRKLPSVKYLDIRKAGHCLHWQPSTSLAEGLEQTMRWYRSNWGKLGKSRHPCHSAVSA